ncbi:MAG: hypothetical protein C0503_04165 [Gemmatimonas sp.]|nr:hypothetical protein [Gemmatimonas sp.]
MVRLYEECAEELGRLDALVAVAPPAVAAALQAAVIARLATDDAQATRAACASLVAARVEMVHAAALDPSLEGWQRRVDDGERRARSGVALAAPAELRLASDAQAAVQDALRPGAEPRPLLLRALQVAAWMPDAPEAVPASHADFLAALVLVAGGLTDRIRVLPFAALRGAERTTAAAAWRAGDPTPLTRSALSGLAANARHLRVQVKLLLESQTAEDAHLASIGRAAFTARDVLAHIRVALATSVPDVSDRLTLSRPAAGAALQRLVDLGLAEEITGRGRDRVFVYAGAWGLL